MHSLVPGLLFEISRTANSMSVAGIVLLLIGLWAAKSDIAHAAGLNKFVALANLCFALPLAVFAAEHFSAAAGISQIVPKFMPWHLFWTYLVGVALLAASLSIATKIQVRWSGLLLGIMFFLFVAMMDLPGTIAEPNNRFNWTLMLRELSFGGAAWILAGNAMGGRGGKALITIGRVILGVSAIFYGVEHFLHPLGMPGVPLEKEIPVWIPARAVFDYLTGVFLVVAGLCFLLNRKTRVAATYLGSWIVVIVLVIYGPVLIMGLLNPSTDVKIEALNYFADTLLYGGAILALAQAMMPANEGFRRA